MFSMTKKPVHEAMAEYVRRELERSGKSKSQAAADSGLHTNTWDKFLSGYDRNTGHAWNITAKHCYAIARGLGLPTREVFAAAGLEPPDDTPADPIEQELREMQIRLDEIIRRYRGDR